MLDIDEMCTPSAKQTWSPIVIFGVKRCERYEVTASSHRFRSAKTPLPKEINRALKTRQPGPRCKPGAPSEKPMTKLWILRHERLRINNNATPGGFDLSNPKTAMAVLFIQKWFCAKFSNIKCIISKACSQGGHG